MDVQTPPKPLRRFSNEELLDLINNGIQEHKISSAADWFRSRKTVRGYKLVSIYARACDRYFLGLGSWDALLENELGIVPLNQGHWSDERLHSTIAKLITRHGSDLKTWKGHESAVHGKTFNVLFHRAKRSNNYRKHAKPFFSNRNWHSYIRWLARKYNTSIETGELKAPRALGINLKRLSDDNLKKLVRYAVQKTGVSSAYDWRTSDVRVGVNKLASVLAEVMRRKREGKPAMGHKRWHVFLEKELGIVPLYHRPWSDERIHQTVAVLAEAHPVEKISWKDSSRSVFQGRSLQSLFSIAARGNRPTGTGESWFGQGSFKKYVKWARENYGEKYVERAWKEQKREAG